MKHKPDPEGLYRILDRLAVPARQTLMVGDSVSDIRAAQAAGIPVASVLWDCLDRSAVINGNADFRFENAGEMLLWLRDQRTA
jgi:phosphoglycolate phosphatase